MGRIGGSVLVGLTVVGSALGVFMGNVHADPPTPQIPGGVAAPTAAEVSPICNAPDPSKVLGPAPSPPANPTSTLVTPPGGVASFTATSTNLYVLNSSQLITYTLSGSEVSVFALPPGFSAGDSPSQPVVDPSGNIYLSSYYGMKMDKLSPTGQVIWSVDPEGGSPTGIFSVGIGAAFELMVSVTQNSSGSEQVNLNTGAVSGFFPLFDNSDFVTQESDGNLLFSGNGYVETISPTGTVLSSFGSSQDQSNGLHTGSGTQFEYPAQAAQGADGTIYTADPLDTIEATSPQGYFESSTTLGQNSNGGGNLAMSNKDFFLVGSTFYYQGGPPFQSASDNISSVSLATLTAYLDGIQAPTNSLGWGAGISTPAAGNYFPPGTTPQVSANFNAGWATNASHLQLSYSVENDASLNAEVVPSPTTVDLPSTAAGLANIPLTIPAVDQQAGPYLVQASLFDTSASPPTLLGTTCMPYTVGATGDRLDLGTLPPAREPVVPPIPGVWPSMPNSGWTGCGHFRSPGATSSPTATPRHRRRRPVGLAP